MELSKSIQIKRAVAPSQMIVNGVPVQQEMTILCCPECGKVIHQLDQSLPPVIIKQFLEQNIEVLEKELQYCSRCGTKLNYRSYDVFDVEAEVK